MGNETPLGWSFWFSKLSGGNILENQYNQFATMLEWVDWGLVGVVMVALIFSRMTMLAAD